MKYDVVDVISATLILSSLFLQIQRTIAYGETKKDIEKWTPTVKKNREVTKLYLI